MQQTTAHRVPAVGMEEPGTHRLAAWLAPAYFTAYLGYLFLRPESEALHWISLVAIPVTLSVATAPPGSGSRVARGLASVGLRWGRLRRGLKWAIPLGLILGALQLLLSRSGEAIRGRLADGSIAWLLPLVFVLMLLTAGFTEELFFRGFLQTRLEALTGSRIWGLVLASVCFGTYHLPYAYLNPNWPSAGDWGAAWVAALGQGIPGGLILGAVYLAAGRNLLAPAVVHALINTLPALTMVHVGGK